MYLFSLSLHEDFFFSLQSSRIKSRDRVRTTMDSSGYSRNYLDAARGTYPEEEKGCSIHVPVCAFFCPFRARLSVHPRYASVSFSLEPSRARTQNKVHARKILCRLKRLLAWGHNRWQCWESGKFIRPKSLSVAERVAPRPATSPL